MENTEGRYIVRGDVRGLIVGVRQVQDRGRIQIPKFVRKRLGLEDGDSVYWVYNAAEERFYIVKAVEL